MKLLYYIGLTLLLFSITAKAANTNIASPEIKTLSAASPIKYNNNTPFSVINIPPLYTTLGDRAYGEQTINFKLHSNAPSAVVVYGKTVGIGETVQFTKSVNSNRGLDIPIHPGVVGAAGSGDYTITLDVKGIQCPAGYTLVDDSNLCYKTSVQTAGNSCPAGYSYNSSTGDCKKTISIAGTVTCPAGTSYSGGACRSSSTGPATSSCPSGFSRSGNSCTKNSQINASTYCPSGYSKNSTNCSKTVSTTPSYSCYGNLYELDGSNCVLEILEVGIWVCPEEGDILGSGSHAMRCRLTGGTPIIKCPNGFSKVGDGEMCSKTQSRPAAMSCPTGYTASGSSCLKTQTVSFNYSCPAGYSHAGTKCNKQVSASLVYSCPNGGTLSGTSCTTTTSTSFSYTCSSGYYLSGNSCKKTVSAQSTLVCPSGWSLSGSKCSITDRIYYN